MTLRDVVRPMPRTRGDLEKRLLNYSPDLKSKLDDPDTRKRFDRIVGEEYDRYSKYFGTDEGAYGAAESSSGHLGDLIYAGSYFVNPGWALVGLGVKAGRALVQLPKKLYNSIGYALNSRDYLGAVNNIVRGVVSYFPGATVLDKGLGRIAQEKMLKRSMYRLRDEMGVDFETWHGKIAREIREKYKDVKDRARNVISPRRGALVGAAA